MKTLHGLRERQVFIGVRALSTAESVDRKSLGTIADAGAAPGFTCISLIHMQRLRR
ncbi:hypothetical protein DES32_1241 [Methylovirgula ligni]|uniref:Uncharacterized protein n=1 Tax=Methylovirgula ligni TaxID=569860 RepID=A0A3D9Z0K2_9HYPH|nr:hypothetical protein DES32_1241 [Methylovirgula ligni]